jgi:hypothetical protein
MPDATTFLTVTAALSAAVQTFVDHVVKQNKWLDTEIKDPRWERRRHAAVHFISFAVGAVLAWSIGLYLLSYLGVSAGRMANCIAAGFLVSFGGSFCKEALGAVREFKKAQESLRNGPQKPKAAVASAGD